MAWTNTNTVRSMRRQWVLSKNAKEVIDKGHWCTLEFGWEGQHWRLILAKERNEKTREATLGLHYQVAEHKPQQSDPTTPEEVAAIKLSWNLRFDDFAHPPVSQESPASVSECTEPRKYGWRDVDGVAGLPPGTAYGHLTADNEPSGSQTSPVSFDLEFSVNIVRRPLSFPRFRASGLAVRPSTLSLLRVFESGCLGSDGKDRSDTTIRCVPPALSSVDGEKKGDGERLDVGHTESALVKAHSLVLASSSVVFQGALAAGPASEGGRFLIDVPAAEQDVRRILAVCYGKADVFDDVHLGDRWFPPLLELACRYAVSDASHALECQLLRGLGNLPRPQVLPALLPVWPLLTEDCKKHCGRFVHAYLAEMVSYPGYKALAQGGGSFVADVLSRFSDPVAYVADD